MVFFSIVVLVFGELYVAYRCLLCIYVMQLYPWLNQNYAWCSVILWGCMKIDLCPLCPVSSQALTTKHVASFSIRHAGKAGGFDLILKNIFSQVSVDTRNQMSTCVNPIWTISCHLQQFQALQLKVSTWPLFNYAVRHLSRSIANSCSFSYLEASNSW